MASDVLKATGTFFTLLCHCYSPLPAALLFYYICFQSLPIL